MTAVIVFDLLTSLFAGVILYRIGKLLTYPEVLTLLLKSLSENDNNKHFIAKSIYQIGRLMTILGIFWALSGILKFVLVNF